MKKYELTNETKEVLGIKLYRIKALRDFRNVSKGDLGGWIAKENNLSHYGNAWVYGNAQVYGNAWVYGNAQVYGNAWVYGNARVYGNAWVYGNARVYGNAWVYGNSWVYGGALVYDNARVYGNAWVYDNARVYGNAWVYGNAQLFLKSRIEKQTDLLNLVYYKFPITITKEGHITIGCKAWTSFKDFEITYKQIGKENNYSEQDIIETYFLVKGLYKTLMKRNNV